MDHSRVYTAIIIHVNTATYFGYKHVAIIRLDIERMGNEEVARVRSTR